MRDPASRLVTSAWLRPIACRARHRRPAFLSCGGSGRRRPLQPAQELVATPRALGVLSHHVAEEGRDVVQTGVLCVAYILAVIVTGLERVVLHRNEIKGHVVETCFTRCHVVTS